MNVLCLRAARISSLLMYLVIPLFWGGCTRPGAVPATVSGTVKLDGQPVGKGAVLMISGEGQAASAELNADGTYQLKCPPGDYQVAITSPPPADPMIKSPAPAPAPVRSIPGRYEDVGTSGLKTTVSAGSNTFNIDLQAVAKGR